MADVAQLVERRFVVPVVAGSIPVVRPRVNSSSVSYLHRVARGLRQGERNERRRSDFGWWKGHALWRG